MPQTYLFQVSLPVTDTLPRNRIVNALHFEHGVGGLFDTDLEQMCSDIVELYQGRYGDSTREVMCKAYDTDAKPNYPRASVVVNTGVVWNAIVPREIALCLSYSGDNRGIKDQRGRCYLMPQIAAPPHSFGLRPSDVTQNWALSWYTLPNESFPDIGGVDWKFGVWSKTYKHFTQTTQAWVNDEWDIQRRRGLRETTRVQAIREG